MTPEMMPPQQGGENDQIVDQILSLVTQMLEMAGPEWVMEFLQAGMEAAQQGGQEQPGMMPQGAPMPQQQMQPGTMAPPQGSGRTVGKPRMM